VVRYNAISLYVTNFARIDKWFCIVKQNIGNCNINPVGRLHNSTVYHAGRKIQSWQKIGRKLQIQ